MALCKITLMQSSIMKYAVMFVAFMLSVGISSAIKLNVMAPNNYL